MRTKTAAFALALAAGCGGGGTAGSLGSSGSHWDKSAKTCAISIVPADAARGVQCHPRFETYASAAIGGSLAIVGQAEPSAMPGFHWPDERFVARFGPKGEVLATLPIGFIKSHEERTPLLATTGDVIFLANGIPWKPLVRVAPNGVTPVLLDDAMAMAVATIAKAPASMERDALIHARYDGGPFIRALDVNRSGVALLVSMSDGVAVVNLDPNGKVRWATVTKSDDYRIAIDGHGAIYLYGTTGSSRIRAFTPSSPLPTFDLSSSDECNVAVRLRDLHRPRFAGRLRT